MWPRGSFVADGGMVGSRCAIEDCCPTGAISKIVLGRVRNRSAGRTRRIVEDCIAGVIARVNNGNVNTGGGRRVVEDYLASIRSYEVLPNAVIVDDAGAAKNQFAPECLRRRDV